MEENNQELLQSLFGKITHLYFRNGFKILQETGVHPKQVPLLHLLNKYEGLSQNEIGRQLNIKPPTVAVSIKRLEKSGIVERRTDENDQRKSLIYLTDKGRGLSLAVKSKINECEFSMFNGFSDAELCLMRRFFNQIIENLETLNQTK